MTILTEYRAVQEPRPSLSAWLLSLPEEERKRLWRRQGAWAQQVQADVTRERLRLVGQADAPPESPALDALIEEVRLLREALVELVTERPRPYTPPVRQYTAPRPASPAPASPAPSPGPARRGGIDLGPA